MGSSAVTQALKEIPGAVNVQNKASGVGQFASAAQVRQELGRGDDGMTGRERFFCFIRSPYELLAAHWLREQGRSRLRSYTKSRRRPVSFLEFINFWAETRPEGYFINGSLFHHVGDAHFVLRHELGLQAEVNKILNRIEGVPGVKVRDDIDTDLEDQWTTLYDEKCFAAVNEHFQQEFTRFSYPFRWD